MNVKQILADLGQVMLLVVAQRVYRPQDAYLGLGEAEVLVREVEALLKADCAPFSAVEYRYALL